MGTSLRSASFRKAARTSARLLKKLPNVIYICIGEKITRGQRAGELSLIVRVTHKDAGLPSSSQVPPHMQVRYGSKIHILPTDVIELDGNPLLFSSEPGVRSGHTVRSFDGHNGTCGLSFVKGTVGYIITNAHVAANIVTNVDGPLRIRDRISGTYTVLGPIKYRSRIALNKIVREDMAIARADHTVVNHFRILDTEEDIRGFLPISLDPRENYFYNINGSLHRCTNAREVLTGVDVAADGAIFTYNYFWEFTMTQGGAAPGHSGALLCRRSSGDIYACGIIFGGQSSGVVYAFPIMEAFNRAYETLSEV